MILILENNINELIQRFKQTQTAVRQDIFSAEAFSVQGESYISHCSGRTSSYISHCSGRTSFLSPYANSTAFRSTFPALVGVATSSPYRISSLEGPCLEGLEHQHRSKFLKVCHLVSTHLLLALPLETLHIIGSHIRALPFFDSSFNRSHDL
jgi:hypothetical protein